jgi:hypothetical protein
MSIRLRLIVSCTSLVVLTLGLPTPTSAQTFVSPLLGYDFGDDSRCPEITGCEDKNLNIGAAIGSMGPLFGLDLIVGPEIGPLRPYATGGIGLIKSHVNFDAASLLDASNNDFGWNFGGGLMVFFGETVGVRGDIRHFHSFQDLDFLGFSLSDTKLDFGRASGSLVFRF